MKKILGLLLFISALWGQTDLPGPIRSIPVGTGSASTAIASWDKNMQYYAGFIAQTGMSGNQVWTMPVGSTANYCWKDNGSFVFTEAPCAFTNVANTWTADQTFSTGNILASGTPNIGSTGNSFNDLYTARANVQDVFFLNPGGASIWVTKMGPETGGSLGYLGLVNNASNITWEFINTGGALSHGQMSPSANLTYDLGSLSLQWNNFYAGTGNISGNLSVGGAIVASACLGCDPTGAWTTYVPTTGNFTSAPSTDCAWQKRGKTVLLRCELNGPVGISTTTFTLPFAATSSNEILTFTYILGGFPATGQTSISGSTVTLQAGGSAPSYGVGGATFTLFIQGVYEST